jgi:hypothetical protein
VGEIIQKCSEVKWIVVRMWRVRKCSDVEWSEGHGKMWVHQFMTLRISLLLPFSVEYVYFLLILIKIIVIVFVVVVGVFALYSLWVVFFVVCVVLCAVFYLNVVCYFVWCVIYVLCLIYVLCVIVVTLPPGKTPFVVKTDNNYNNKWRWRRRDLLRSICPCQWPQY